ncbi:hypothetical protein EON76_06260 [bacterium]|nr:MAG: hypothetical protein EON76_06260 [bacterium]
MTKVSHRSHTFSSNFIGSIGYLSTLLVWLLVLNALIQIFALQTALSNVSSPLYAVLPGTLDQSAGSESNQLLSIKFLLIGLLLIVIWALVYIASRIGTKIIRHFLRLFGKKVTIDTLVRAKYLWLCLGLLLLAALLLFIPNSLVYLKMPLAFIGFVAGCIGVGAIWVQSVLVARYRLKVDDLV